MGRDSTQVVRAPAELSSLVAGFSSAHVLSERQPQPMHVVSRPRIASSVSMRSSSSLRQLDESRSQSRFVGDLPEGSVSSAC